MHGNPFPDPTLLHNVMITKVQIYISKTRVIKLTAGLESVVGVSDVISGVSVSVVSCDSSVIAPQKCDGEGELDEHLSVSLSQLLLHL